MNLKWGGIFFGILTFLFFQNLFCMKEVSSRINFLNETLHRAEHSLSYTPMDIDQVGEQLGQECQKDGDGDVIMKDVERLATILSLQLPSPPSTPIDINKMPEKTTDKCKKDQDGDVIMQDAKPVSLAPKQLDIVKIKKEPVPSQENLQEWIAKIKDPTLKKEHKVKLLHWLLNNLEQIKKKGLAVWLLFALQDSGLSDVFNMVIARI